MAYENLHHDWKLTPDTYGYYDITFKAGDLQNITGAESLENGIRIAILTRQNEIKTSTYKDFGCRIYETIKANKNNMTRYRIEQYTQETLKKIRRIKKINELTVTDTETDYNYEIYYNVTSIDDETVEGTMLI